MRNVSKKILGIATAAMMVSSVLTFAACGDDSYKGEKVDGFVSVKDGNVEISSNGGFVVERGDYVYFINGVEEYTASNSYGDVVKGALMCISKSDLKDGNYDNAKIVVPSLFAAQNFNAGIYIFGDYVYYATPTNDANLKGETMNTQIDFKRAKLDGSEAPMKEPYFRLKSNSSTYRFVQVAGVDRNNDGEDDVFCLYEEDSKLKSYNTATDEHTVLVSGAKSSFVYDTTDPTNPNVYYTMSVVYDAEKTNSTTASYDQIYCVNAAARVSEVNASAASYTVEGGRTYDFDEAAMKKNAESKGYDLSDYTTYPYVNLGGLVLDGVGYASAQVTQFNDEKDLSKASEPQGYNYTITSYQTSGESSGVYFTRAKCVTNESESATSKLYYVTDERDSWNSVTANEVEKCDGVDVVAKDTTNASSSALFAVETVNGARKHSYIYLSNSTLYKAEAATDGTEINTVAMAYELSSITLWKTEGEYLYFYGTGTNGNNVSRINYTGDKKAYNDLLVTDEYSPVTLSLVDWSNSWYKPEFVTVKDNDGGDVQILLYPNAQSYAGGSTSYDYIYAAKIGSTEQILKDNEDYEAYEEYLDSYSDSANTQNLIKFFFGCNETVSQESEEEYNTKLFEEVKGKFASVNEAGETVVPELRKADTYIAKVSRMTEDDAEAITEAWHDSLPVPDDDDGETESTWPDWATWLIVIGSVVVVAAAVIIPAVIVTRKKKAEKLEAEATVNAYKRRKIDTTDDKSIDVYADEEEESVDDNSEE